MTITVPESLNETTHPQFNTSEVTKYLNSFDSFNNYLVETMSRQNSNLYKINIDGHAAHLDDFTHKGILSGGFGISYLAQSKRYISSYILSNTVVLWKDEVQQQSIEVEKPTVIVVSKDESELAVLSLDGSVSFFSLKDFKLIRKFDKSIKTLFMSAYA